MLVPRESVGLVVVSPSAHAVEAVAQRARRASDAARVRWDTAMGPSSGSIDEAAARFASVARLTVNLHPDRVARSGRTVAAGLLADGSWRTQWSTGISNGGRSAVVGGDRQRWESALFDGAYAGADPERVEFPAYGAFDLCHDPHGGSPRFGSSYFVLRAAVRERSTLCVGDSHADPIDVGTIDVPDCLLAGLAEQAAANSLLDRALGVHDLVDLLHSTPRRRIPPAPARSLDGYVEAQIHGGIHLATDVEAVVVDPSFRHTTVEDHLARAADRYGFALLWHAGSELEVAAVPHDFRGPTMPGLARAVARRDGIIDAAAIGRAAVASSVGPAGLRGDPPESAAQQLKYLWHTVLAFGSDAASSPAMPNSART